MGIEPTTASGSATAPSGASQPDVADTAPGSAVHGASDANSGVATTFSDGEPSSTERHGRTQAADASIAQRAESGPRGASSEAEASSQSGPTDGQTLVAVPGARFAELSVTSIRPNSKQPRTVFDEEDMDELVHSVREIGVLQPVVVRPDTTGEAEYELVMGERRWRASQAAGLDAIPAIIRDTTDDNLLRDALLENLHRSELNPLEEAAAYQQLMAEFGCTQDELSQRIGRSRPQISNTIRLLKLAPEVQLKVAAGTLSAGHARALLGLKDPSMAAPLADRIIREGLSVRSTEELVSQQDALLTDEPKKTSRENPRHERLDYLATSLSDRLDTNVKITLGARKGKVQIDFASVEDLNRIMDILGNG
ncbi:ParB/RepB/Spo0J family partition protein [Falsarthrobacter nasiphocae]|nr:ParB/RepB/Spo0J family partition protein [Falsarthrobacter nasiphocae]